MGRYDGAWTDEAVLRDAARWMWWPEGAVVLEDERRLLVHMPAHWDKSIVFRASVADAGRAADLIEETIREVRTAGRSKLIWHTNGATEPAGMGRLLEECGFQLTEELDVLAFDLGDGLEPRLPTMEPPASVSAKPVRDVEGIREVWRVKAEVFSDPEPSDEEIAEFAGELGKLARRERGEDPSGTLTLFFLAEIEGEPAASAGVMVAGEAARLWGGGTLERFRGRGSYRALVAERCRAAHALGAKLALTRARAGTAGLILRRAGFRKAGTERRYTLGIS